MNCADPLLRLRIGCLCVRLALVGLLLGGLGRPVKGQQADLPNPFDFLAVEADEVPPLEPADAATRADLEQQPEVEAENFKAAEIASESVDEETAPLQPVASPPEVMGAAPAAVNAPQEAMAPPPETIKDPPETIDALPEVAAAEAAGVGDDVFDQRYKQAWLIDIEGPIFGQFHWYLNNRLDQAQQAGADLILLRLTSPGGDLEHSLQLAWRLRDIDWARTVVFIPQEAISGGAIIALGCDRIVMQSGALIGDAGPVRLGLQGFEHAEEKVVSYLAGAIRELALANDRPAALAEAMVDRSLVIYEATELATGQTVYVTQKEVDMPGAAAKYDIGPPIPESGQNRFLTLGADRAAALGMCEAVVASEAELLQRLDAEELQATRLNWVDRSVYLLNRPWLTALLLIVGLVGLYLELIAPGLSVAGLTSLVCFSVFFWSHFLGGTAGWLEVLLFCIGVISVLCELFVLPGFGVFGITGVCLVVLSLVMASQDFVIPDSASEWSEFRGNLLIVLGSVLGVMLLIFLQILVLDSMPGLNRFRLAAPAAGPEQSTAEQVITALTQGQTLKPPLAPGQFGQAASDLRPSGKVTIDDTLYDVVTEGDFVDAGSAIEVIRVEGNRIVVRKVGVSG